MTNSCGPLCTFVQKYPKWFLELEGGHNDGFLRFRARYVAGIQRFLDRVFGLE